MDTDLNSKLFRLPTEVIQKMAKNDINGAIGNVLRGFRQHCYGVSVEQDSIENIEFFYINDSITEPGYIFRLKLGEDHFYELLCYFAIFLVEIYEDLEPSTVYNTYIEYLRTQLESRNIFTISTLELKPLKGRNMTLMTGGRPIEIVKNFEKKDFYKHYLNTPDSFEIKPNTNYLYLMLNTDTNYIKIGRSNDPKYRERTLHSKEPSVVLLKIWECEKEIERKLHMHFRQKKVRGEWFKLSLEDLIKFDSLIENLKSTVANNTYTAYRN